MPVWFKPPWPPVCRWNEPGTPCYCPGLRERFQFALKPGLHRPCPWNDAPPAALKAPFPPLPCAGLLTAP